MTNTVTLMRLRLPEVLEERGLTAYEVAARSDGRINESTLYRLIRQRGVVRNFSAELLESLCDVLEVDIGALITRDPPPPERERSPSFQMRKESRKFQEFAAALVVGRSFAAWATGEQHVIDSVVQIGNCMGRLWFGVRARDGGGIYRVTTEDGAELLELNPVWLRRHGCV